MLEQFNTLSTNELEQVNGGGGNIGLEVINEVAAGICSFFDGFNGKKYRGKC